MKIYQTSGSLMVASKNSKTAIDLWREDPFAGFINHLKSCNEDQTLVGQAMIGLLNQPGHAFAQSEGRELAQKFIAENSSVEINFYALFLAIWVIAASNGLNYEESKLIVRKLQEVDSDTLYPEMQATILATIGFHLGTFGNKLIRIQYIQKALLIKDLNEMHKVHLINGLTASLVTLGCLNDLEKITRGVSYDPNHVHIKKVEDFTLLGNYLQLCKIPLALDVLKRIKSNPKSLKVFNSELNQYEVDEKFINFIHDSDSTDFESYLLSDEQLDFYKKWMAATGYLIKKNKTLGLKWARRYASEHSIGMRNRNLLSFTLIRAEIVNLNCVAAKSLLMNKKRLGYPHYLDDFFYARIALIEGDEELALKLIAKLHKSCQHYDAFDRLNFELELSCELSTKDMHKFIPLNLNERKYEGIPLFSYDNDLGEKQNTIIGDSVVIKNVKNSISKASNNNGIVLLLGETGVGKEVFAREIHEQSDRKNKSFIPINCGALSEALLQSELFGHEAGAFTGAKKYHEGVFEAAGKGTVFLDEIGEVTKKNQVALLRVLEKFEIQPVGSAKTKKIQCKIVAATNKNLEDLVSQGKFREDLYYRINQYSILIPPLRDRGSDILKLAYYFLGLNRSDGETPRMSKELETAFIEYNWPGNVRQLKNEIEKMRILNSEKMYYDVNDLAIKDLVLVSDAPSKKAPLAAKVKINSSLELDDRTPFRRKDKILDLFMQAEKLTRAEIIKALNIAPGTATKYLKVLVEGGWVKRVMPTASPRTHYFEYCNPSENSDKV